MKSIAVMTSGGDSPGMNAAIRAVVRMAVASDVHVQAIKRGFAGLVDGEITEMTGHDVGGVIQRGGTILQTARCPEFSDLKVQRQGLRRLNEHRVEGLVVIGGDGSMRGAQALHNLGFPVVGVPASIDNDIWGTNMSIGVDTALNTIVETIDKIRDTASSLSRAFLIETMGRQCGYLALIGGMIGGAEMTLIPEQVFSMEEVAQAIADAYVRGKTHAIIVVAEGASIRTTELAKFIEDSHTGFEVRITILGHIQRGGRPTAFDRLLATRLGVGAYEMLMAGQSGVMAGLQGRDIVPVPLLEVTGRQRRANLKYYELARILSR